MAATLLRRRLVWMRSMPLLDNPKHEIFAQELAKGASQKDAYEAVGYKPSEPHAARLASNGKVLARVAELQAVVAERTEITLESLIRRFDHVHQLAVRERQLSAANGALTAMAKLAGLWTEKSENRNANRNVDPESLSDEELAAIITSGRG